MEYQDEIKAYVVLHFIQLGTSLFIQITTF